MDCLTRRRKISTAWCQFAAPHSQTIGILIFLLYFCTHHFQPHSTQRITTVTRSLAAMTRLVKVVKSKKPRKKYDAVFDDGDVVSFGATGYSDFTQHHDESRKKAYMRRHKRQEDWSNPKTAGTLSRYILWNKPTLSESVKDFKQRFND